MGKPRESSFLARLRYQGEHAGVEQLDGVGTLQAAKKEALLSLLRMMEVSTTADRVVVTALVVDDTPNNRVHMTLTLDIQDLPDDAS